MRKRSSPFAMGAALVSSGLILAAMALPAAASAIEDCRAPRPDADVPGSATTESAPDDLASQSLSRKLATCGSVLDPPPVGDPDIIEPAPRIGDPMNIHPRVPEDARP